MQLLQLRRFVAMNEREVSDVYKESCSGKTSSRPTVDVDLPRFLELLQRRRMSKAKAR